MTHPEASDHQSPLRDATVERSDEDRSSCSDPSAASRQNAGAVPPPGSDHSVGSGHSVGSQRSNDSDCRFSTDGSQPDEEVLAAMALSLVPGIGPRTQSVLVREFSSASNVLAQPYERLMEVEGIGPKLARSMVSDDLRPTALQTWHICRQQQIEILTLTSHNYPERLREICDAPAVLYRRGSYRVHDELAIAIVGSRRCTAYGRKQAERIAASLARAGLTIISGLARGIDAAAHRGALNAGGRTIAVLASGVRDIYPPEHADLAMGILSAGALISEMPIDQKPRPGLFPQRNRIISGLSLGVIVVEATRNSGALYTARHGLEQGREVFAVPGNADSIASDGCHDLIRDGVTLIRTADDVLAELGPLATPLNASSDVRIHNPRELILNALETEVLNLLNSSPVHVDEILRATQLDSSRVLATLTVLEMRRFVRRLPGSLFVRFE